MDFWGYKERVEETGILEIWKEELQDTTLGEVRCEFELFFRSDPQKRDRNEQQLRNDITTLGGTVISSSVITDIAYHAVLATVPRDVAEWIINGNRDVSIVTAEHSCLENPHRTITSIFKRTSIFPNRLMPSVNALLIVSLCNLFSKMFCCSFPDSRRCARNQYRFHLAILLNLHSHPNDL
jgi:hypothetical protein